MPDVNNILLLCLSLEWESIPSTSSGSTKCCPVLELIGINRTKCFFSTCLSDENQNIDVQRWLYKNSNFFLNLVLIVWLCDPRLSALLTLLCCIGSKPEWGEPSARPTALWPESGSVRSSSPSGPLTSTRWAYSSAFCWIMWKRKVRKYLIFRGKAYC